MERPNGTAPSEHKEGGTMSGFASSVPTRRRVMRLPATRDVWVYWECGGTGDVSHVRDLSTGGIFIETAWRRTKGELVRVHFLVQEGQISLDGVVAQAQPPKGLGLKFQSVATKDISKLTSLLDRVRAASLA
jgi:PilZ domain